MFQENLISLRKLNGLSQEELAEKVGISRQTLSKYETGEAVPDIQKCKKLADIFQVSLDDLVNYEKDENEFGVGVPPKGKHIFGMVKVGDKGQIVIHAKARKIFRIEHRSIFCGDRRNDCSYYGKHGQAYRDAIYGIRGDTAIICGTWSRIHHCCSDQLFT